MAVAEGDRLVELDILAGEIAGAHEAATHQHQSEKQDRATQQGETEVRIGRS